MKRRVLPGAINLATLWVFAVPVHAVCVGDCDGNGFVAVNELVSSVNIFLENTMVTSCPNADQNGDMRVVINEVVAAVNSFLDAATCPDVQHGITPTITATPTVTTTATQTPTVTRTPTVTATPCGLGRLPATGQTTCWSSQSPWGTIPCGGTGQDGEARAGAARSYTDNGDATITDNVTGLMWEKKDNSGVGDQLGIHNGGRGYVWAEALDVFVARLNDRCAKDETVDCSLGGDTNCGGVGGPCGFAGYRDWRLPNVNELYSLVNFELGYPGPSVDLAFNTNCTPGCVAATCSCTQSSNDYWSSTTHPASPDRAWKVVFSDGGWVDAAEKTGGAHVRAVRGGTPCGLGRLPATGQTTCWSSQSPWGTIPCGGTGQDGEARAGAARSYTDNGDGTITDNVTGLMWEKRTESSGPHGWTGYTWGNALDVFIPLLNNRCADETTDCTVGGDLACAGIGNGWCGFAGYRDWRLPNIRELESLVSFGVTGNPTVDLAFNNNCTPGCSVATCSCTTSTAYWSSTSSAFSHNRVWVVEFANDHQRVRRDEKEKYRLNFVRAVRGGT